MLHDNVFRLDVYQLAVQLLPTARRTPINLAFLKVLTLPFRKQLKRLNEQRSRNIYTLTHDARVGRVERVLNDRFDVVERRIRLAEGNRISPLYIYTEAEAEQTYLDETIYTQKEIRERNTDFVVNVPRALGLSSEDLQVLEYLTRYYTDKDKQFKVELV